MSTLETLLIAFVAVTALAVIIQMAVLVALYASIKRSSTRMETLGGLVEMRLVPMLETVHTVLQEYRPKLETVLNNAADTSTLVKQRVEQVDAGLTEALQRSRVHLIRVDDLMTRTLDRVESATELVHHSVSSPVRHASGVLQGIAVGLATLFRKGPPAPARHSAGVPKDNMFV